MKLPALCCLGIVVLPPSSLIEGEKPVACGQVPPKPKFPDPQKIVLFRVSGEGEDYKPVLSRQKKKPFVSQKTKQNKTRYEVLCKKDMYHVRFNRPRG